MSHPANSQFGCNIGCNNRLDDTTLLGASVVRAVFLWSEV